MILVEPNKVPPKDEEFLPRAFIWACRFCTSDASFVVRSVGFNANENFTQLDHR